MYDRKKEKVISGRRQLLKLELEANFFFIVFFKKLRRRYDEADDVQTLKMRNYSCLYDVKCYISIFFISFQLFSRRELKIMSILKAARSLVSLTVCNVIDIFLMLHLVDLCFALKYIKPTRKDPIQFNPDNMTNNKMRKFDLVIESELKLHLMQSL